MKALQEHEIAYDPDKVVWFHTEDRRKKPALMVRNMVRQNSFPDGIVCYNDQIAVQVMEELERQGKKIPEDVAVTGYEAIRCTQDSRNHYYHPSPGKTG